MWRVDALHQNETHVEEGWNLDEEHQNNDLEIDDELNWVVEDMIVYSEDWTETTDYLADHNHLNAVD